MEEASSIFVLYEQIASVDIIYMTTIFSSHFRCHQSHTHFSIQLLSVIYKFQHYKFQNTFFSCLFGFIISKVKYEQFITDIFFFFVHSKSLLSNIEIQSIQLQTGYIYGRQNRHTRYIYGTKDASPEKSLNYQICKCK